MKPSEEGVPVDLPTAHSMDEKLNESAKYYTHLFRKVKSINPGRCLELLKGKQISKSEKDACDKPIDNKEIIRAIRTLARGKSPGPDLIPSTSSTRWGMTPPLTSLLIKGRY